jgi:CheY-like chemotaxis protein
LILADRLIPTAELIPTTDHSSPSMKATVLIAEDAVKQALALQPDVLSLDIRMPGMTGLEAAQTLAEDWPDLAKPFPLLVFVTAYD